MIYVARRPFHPGRLAATLRAHFSLALESPSSASSSGAASADAADAANAAAAAAAAEAAARAAISAEALAERLRAALGSSADPVAVSAAASAAASAASASASAAAAVSSARLLARLLSESETPATSASVPGGQVPRVPAPAPSGPFAGVLRSGGAAWIASRPSTAARWTQPDPDAPGAVVVACAGSWDADRARCAVPERAGAFVGERRQEIVFEGTRALDREKLRAALDACLLREDEQEQDETDPNHRDDSDSMVADAMGLCFAPWPEQIAHLASLGVRVGGRGSAALAAAASVRAHGWGGAAPADLRENSKASASVSGAASGETAGASRPRPFGMASLQFGGKVGVVRPEAFVAPPKGVEVKQFPEGTGHFWPKMPCLECGSPWWLGDDWDAECANCGSGAESYDNSQQPHKEYKRRFERFRKLVDALDRGGGAR